MSDAPKTGSRVDARYIVAVAFMLAAAIGWNVALYGLDLAKRPVPAPDFAVVQDHRLHNFPDSFGDFVLAPETDPPTPDDRKQDGITELSEDILDVLGTLKHEWNWYYMATYRDTRRSGKQKQRWVRLDITYYTGLLEAVPHVGERCIAASGGTVLRDKAEAITVAMGALPADWEEQWKKIDVYRTPWEKTKKDGSIETGVQYHVFSVNGSPMAHWEQIRWDLGSPLLRYCYFAKIQIAAFEEKDRGGAKDGDTNEKHDLKTLKGNDAYCAEFLREAMPHILKVLPTVGDVRRLEQGDKASDKPKE